MLNSKIHSRNRKAGCGGPAPASHLFQTYWTNQQNILYLGYQHICVTVEIIIVGYGCTIYKRSSLEQNKCSPIPVALAAAAQPVLLWTWRDWLNLTTAAGTTRASSSRRWWVSGGKPGWLASDIRERTTPWEIVPRRWRGFVKTNWSLEMEDRLNSASNND